MRWLNRLVPGATCFLGLLAALATTTVQADPPQKESAEVQRIARLLADLDHDRFDVREKATVELEDLGKSAVPALRQTLTGQPSLEVRRRVEQLLAKLDPPPPLRPLATYNAYTGSGSRSFIRAFPPPGTQAKDRQPAKDAKQEQPAKGAALKLTATVDGYTQPTQFNQQKYPFKYKGSSQLDAEQVKALSKAGDVPAEITKALLDCLLWPKEGDTLEKATLKSDGKKLTGDAEVLHKYGKQGTHTLKLKLEGAVEEGRLSLKVTNSSVSGTWDSGFPIKLQGMVDIKIDVERP